MPYITCELLRKKSEHNDCILATLEEISLHQEELEDINHIMGQLCKKLKIIYLQNNIISKMENIHYFKDLRYLNLALNNITIIENLQNCEFIEKLDLTMNFIDLDTLADSMIHLQSRLDLKQLYMMGNPCQVNWKGFNDYVIAKLPQLLFLDGMEITKTMRILATQRLPSLECELKLLAHAKSIEKASTNIAKESSMKETISDKISSTTDTGTASRTSLDDSDNILDSTMTENTPETRVQIYRELAEQKRIQEVKRRGDQPRERNFEKEHVESVGEIRRKELQMSEG